MPALVLPKASAEFTPRDNASLFLCKYFPYHDQGKEREKQEYRTLCQKLLSSGHQPELLQRKTQSREAHLLSLGACDFSARLVSNMALHLAREIGLENAHVCLHPLYGFAYIPATGLKGMARTWAEHHYKPENGAEVSTRIHRVFGAISKGKSSEGEVGGIVFHDAWPTNWPSLCNEVLTVHHSEYYNGQSAPGDWESPTPVHFFAVSAGAEFKFFLHLREIDLGDGDRQDGLCEEGLEGLLAQREADLKFAQHCLQQALRVLGSGAKTNAGYGRFEILGQIATEMPASRRLHTQTFQLRLDSPAFFAGYDQSEQDCELRPASLRGVLRWWWRTLHAGQMEPKDLLELETALFGSASLAGAVGLEVRQLNKSQVEIHEPDRKDYDMKYLSYGMYRDNTKLVGRAKMDHGSLWELTLTMREVKPIVNPKDKSQVIQKLTLSQERVKTEVVNALTLLCNLGGIGGKSRKGFGSLSCEALPWVQCEKIILGCRQLTYASFCASSSLSACEIQSFPMQTQEPMLNVAKAYKLAVASLEKPKRKILGLPRKSSDRFASPVHIHVSRDMNTTNLHLVGFFHNNKNIKVEESKAVINKFFQEFSTAIKSGVQSYSSNKTSHSTSPKAWQNKPSSQADHKKNTLPTPQPVSIVTATFVKAGRMNIVSVNSQEVPMNSSNKKYTPGETLQGRIVNGKFEVKS